MKRAFLLSLLSLSLLTISAGVVSAQIGPGPILPDCTAENTNLKDNELGCGKDDFINLIINVIEWMEIIIIPIAIAVVGYQAFVIITSTGNGEKVGHATKMIGVAVTGIVILLLSHLVIQLIFSALSVEQEFLPGGIEAKKDP